MQRLKALVYEDSIDAVVRSLGHAGIVQFIDMREKPEDWHETLVPHKESVEIVTKCSDLISRIEVAFETLHIMPDDFPTPEISITKDPTQKVLAAIEQKATRNTN